MIRINCDIGERGMDHPVDLALMDHIDIANLACGGHAGDKDSVRAFLDLARKKNVSVSAHLSYPDKANFGRTSMDMPIHKLKDALDEQVSLMPDASMVKFHGGLYNDSCHDPVLAGHLADWLAQHHITVILAPEGSAMARAARDRGLTVLAEAFAERRYQYWPDENRLALMGRDHDIACIHDQDEAVSHATSMVRDGWVEALVKHETGNFFSKQVAISCDTLCVHSDSSISLPLTKRLSALNQNGWNHEIEVLSGGVFREISAPKFGKQDLGVSPQGAMDRFSYETGNILLANPGGSPAFEIILHPRLRFTRETLFVVTGAAYTGIRLIGNTVRQVDHGKVYRAYPMDILEFGEKAYGFRTYLCYKTVKTGEGGHIEGRERGEFSKISRWHDPSGRIRVLDGPEKYMLKHPDDFFHGSFFIHPDSNAMGLRLNGWPLDAHSSSNMISGPVADGTVQLTPNGPVVLLRQRQTLGGYPRIFNVITPDLDRLAQYAPGEHIRFKRVSLEQARDCLKQWHEDLDSIKHHNS